MSKIYEDGMVYDRDPSRRLVLYEVAPITRDFEIVEAGALSESRNGNIYKLKGLFHLAETRNANGRIYPKKLLEREVRNIIPQVKSKSIYGALDHPTDPTMKLGGENGAAVMITDLQMKGNKVLGELQILNTSVGKDLRAIIEDGGRVGISSRGLGSLNEDEDGTKIVQEDYQLITWDVVPNPSTPDAWLTENEKIIKNSKIQKDNDRKGEYDFSEVKLRNRINDLFGGNEWKTY